MEGLAAQATTTTTGESSPTALYREVITASKDVLSSIAGSTLCTYTGQPFDTIKVRMQARPDAWKTTLQCVQNTIQQEGIYALWKGSLPSLVGQVSENAVAFSINQFLKRVLQSDSYKSTAVQPQGWLLPFCTGGFTGFFTAIALCPSDVIKCKVQVSREHLRAGEHAMTPKEMLRHVLRTQGVRGLFVGLDAQIARDIPFYAVFFGTYDSCVSLLRENTSLPVSMSWVVGGGLAGVAGWVATMPMDTVKSIIQTSEAPKSYLVTLREVVGRRGLTGLYAGLGVASVRAFPANAALFLGYELMREVLGE